MYYLQDAHSFWNWVYFVCLTIIGSFFMTNICLAVISAQFSITKKRETEKILLEQSRLAHSSSSLAISNQDSCWEALIKQIQRFFRHLSRRIHNRCKKNQKVRTISVLFINRSFVLVFARPNHESTKRLRR